MPELHEALSEYGELQRRYGAHWPKAKLTERRDTAPAALLRTALNTLKAWGEASEDLVRDIERKESERARLLRLRGLLEAGHEGLPKLSHLASTGPVLAAVAYELPRDQWPESLPASVVTRRIATPHSGYIIAVGLAEDIAALRSDLETLKGREVPLPDWLPDDPVDAQRRLDHRLDDIAESLAALESELQANTAAFRVEHALGDLELLSWLVGHLGDVPSTPHFAWVVGWTSDPSGEVLQRALREAGVRFLLRCPATPAPGREAPMLFRNPSWVKPFELFARLLGTPGASEADPSRLVAVLAPLLFGFMFGDVGHGLVLLVAGLVLRRRYPATAVLVPGGLVSILFGFAFGSIFAIEGLIPALWLHPLQEPLTLLWVSLLIGGSSLPSASS